MDYGLAMAIAGRVSVSPHCAHTTVLASTDPAEDGIEPWLNLSKAARLLQVSPRTLRLAAEAREIEGIHPLPDGPWIFSRVVLSSHRHALSPNARGKIQDTPRDRIPINKAYSLQ